MTYLNETDEGEDFPCFSRADFRFDRSAPRDRPLTMARQITPELRDALGLRPSDDHRFNTCVDSMVADALEADVDNMAVSVILNKNKYRELSRYNDAMRYATITRALTAVQELNLVEIDKGLPWDQGGRGKQTRFWPTDRLREIAGNDYVATLSPRQELIVLKDAEKNRIAYRDTEQTERWRRETGIINEAIASADIRISADDVEWKDGRVSIPDALKQQGGGFAPLILRSDSIVLRRSFNNSCWKDGGRFYGHWIQRINKDRRSQVTINGYEVALLDYKSSHIGILYAWAGVPLDNDPYDIKGFERSKIKLGLLIAINAGTFEKAVKALAYELLKQDEDVNDSSYPRISHLNEAKRIIEAIKERHQPIANWFCSGVGVRLQFEEAEVLRRVMIQSIKLDVVCLPVHDELVVPRGRQSSSVEDLMIECWIDRFGTFPVFSQ